MLEVEGARRQNFGAVVAVGEHGGRSVFREEVDAAGAGDRCRPEFTAEAMLPARGAVPGIDAVGDPGLVDPKGAGAAQHRGVEVGRRCDVPGEGCRVDCTAQVPAAVDGEVGGGFGTPDENQVVGHGRRLRGVGVHSLHPPQALSGGGGEAFD